jgi:hypothetical protein
MIATSTVVLSDAFVPGGLLAGVLNVLVTMSPDLSLSFLRIWITLASFLGLRKKPHAWGVTFDSVTKRPIDPVYLSLCEVESGKVLANTVSGLDGRYGFLALPGTYEIKVDKTHYQFPSERLRGFAADIIYSDLYFGGPVTIDNAGLIIKNIPLDPLGFDWNQFAKSNKSILKFYGHLSALEGKIMNVFFTFGFLISVALLFLSYQPLNIVIAILYTVVGVTYSLAHRAPGSGRIEEAKNGWPIPYAIVRVFSLDSKVELAHSVCDKYGRYYCLVPPGDYLVRIERKNDKGDYELAHSSIIHAAHGIIRKKFKV